MTTRSKTKTNTTQTNSLPSWLTNPYQQATATATNLAAQPAISAGTQQALTGLTQSGQNIANTGTQSLGTLSSFANGNFGTSGQALTDAASGSYLRSNPYASGVADTGYIDQSGLNKTAAGDYLTADSNPYISNVANQAADAAQARINAQFGSAGRSNGSGLYAQLFGQGISNAANQIYYTNYQNERNLQQQAQYTLLGAQQTSRENALSRGATAYQNERALQQSASGDLLNTQLGAIAQQPSIMSAILGGNTAALSAGEYADNAAMNRLQQYTGILSGLAAPYAISNTSGTTTQSTGGLGAALGTIAQLGGAAAGLATGTGGLSSLSSFFTPNQSITANAASGLNSALAGRSKALYG